MNIKQKLFNYFNNLIISSVFLWAMLTVLSFISLKPEIIIRFFFIFPLFLFLILYFRQIFVFLTINLNDLNYYLRFTNKINELNFLTKRKLLYIFLIQLLTLINNYPRLLKYFFKSNFFWSSVIVTGILIDIFIFNFISDLLILLLICLWIISVRRYKFKGRISICMTLWFLTLCPFLLTFKKGLIAEKAAIWAYLFLVVGVIQLLRENTIGVKELKD